MDDGATEVLARSVVNVVPGTLQGDPMLAEPRTVRLASGLTLSYVDQGDRSASMVVLLPGPLDSWRCYEPVLDRLPATLRGVAYSQRGHGDSDKPDTGYTVQAFADDLADLLDALGVDRPVVAGHSGAGLFARRFALDHAERIAGLVLEATPPTLRGDAGLESFLHAVLADLDDPVDVGLVRRVIGDTTGALSLTFAEAMVQETLKVPAHVWRETFAGLLNYDDTAELPHLNVPVLLIWGQADDLVTRDKQDTLLRAIPRAELVTYAGIGHSPHWEDPSRFADDLAGFVKRVTWRRRQPSANRTGRLGARRTQRPQAVGHAPVRSPPVPQVQRVAPGVFERRGVNRCAAGDNAGSPALPNIGPPLEVVPEAVEVRW
jgi:pimeloyl-ACP methyl ester carboxylesterase